MRAEGRVIHTQGWPLDEHANGGGFLYHQANGQVALGFVTWLNYRNPHISPFQEMQKWKTHPEVAALLKGGKRVSYVRKTLGGSGRRVYTAQIGYSSRGEANAFCSQFRALGGRCIVLKN